jgi:uncharacterized protein (TIGR01777 family)
MRVTILGATGFIGPHLADALRARGDEVVPASLRDPAGAAAASRNSDVVVNLAGAPVAVRWTAAAKEAMWSSRVDAARAFLAGLDGLDERPSAYVSASAIGYYGASRIATFTETSPPGDDFLARLCVAWEATADTAFSTLGMRVTKVRTGLVLGTDGGVLGKLLPIFRLGLGGVIAGGRQWNSWIHLEDQIGIYLLAIDGAAGVLNATAPNPVTNREFTHALASAVGRPALFPVPGFAARLLFGEGAYVITQGQRVLPDATRSAGYTFRHPTLDEALRSLLK